MVYMCVARPAMGFIHHDGPCRCFSNGPRPEFPLSSGVPPEERKDMNSVRKWDTYCHVYPESHTEYRDFGDPRYVKMFDEKYPISAVCLIEDPMGDYMGWLDYKHPKNGLVMVERVKIFDISFPYGHKVEEEAGKGEAVRVRAELRDENI